MYQMLQNIQVNKRTSVGNSQDKNMSIVLETAFDNICGENIRFIIYRFACSILIWTNKQYQIADYFGRLIFLSEFYSSKSWVKNKIYK